MGIIAVIAIVLTAPAFWYAMRYNLHMFQLNEYNNKEQGKWIAQRHGKERILLALVVFGVVNILRPNIWTLICQAVFALIACWYFRYLKTTKAKKGLVFTARAKRMIGTDIVLTALVCIIVYAVIHGMPRAGVAATPAALTAAAGAFGIMAAAQLLIFPIANQINAPVEKNIRNWYIRDAKRILAERPDLTVIGVTGSYGKTSVKFYLETLLKSRYNVLVTPASYNTPMGIVITVRQMLKPSHEVFVCEMGARCKGEIKEVCDIANPDHGIITAIGPQHLETFHDIDTIVDTKFELADALPEGGMLFLNGDNFYISERARKYGDPIFYRHHSKGPGYCASDIRLSRQGTEFTMTAPNGEKEVFRTRLVGEHNVINIAGTIAVANKMGIPLRELRVPVRRIKAAAHRMEMKESGGVTIIDDAYNSNPVGSKAAVETLAMFDGLKILVTPGMVELGDQEDEFNYKFGTYAANCCDHIVLVGRAHTDPIMRGALDAGFPDRNLRVFEDVKDAMSYVYSIPSPLHKYILLENDLPDNY